MGVFAAQDTTACCHNTKPQRVHKEIGMPGFGLRLESVLHPKMAHFVQGIGAVLLPDLKQKKDNHKEIQTLIHIEWVQSRCTLGLEAIFEIRA